MENSITIPGITIGEATRVIVSSKRCAFIDDHAICFNKSRSEFYLVTGDIKTRIHQELEGGVEARKLILTEYAREVLLEFWRSGRREWMNEHFKTDYK